MLTLYLASLSSPLTSTILPVEGPFESSFVQVQLATWLPRTLGLGLKIYLFVRDPVAFLVCWHFEMRFGNVGER